MRIKLAENFRAIFYAPFYAAKALGYYAREGIDVDFVPSSVPGDAVSAVLDGTIDITWGGPMRVMKAREQQRASPLVCFLISGADKAEAVERAFAEPPSHATPASLIRSRHGRTLAILDRAAASRLP